MQIQKEENMSKLSAIIVDDEQLARRGLQLRLEELSDIEVKAQCSNGEEAISAISALQPDVVFLDIQMPGMSGFDVVSRLQGDNLPLIIFVTAFDQYAIDAFKVHAVDYVLKPIDDERLKEAIERAQKHIEQQQNADSKEKLMKLLMEYTGSNDVDALIESNGNTYPDTINIKDGSEIQRVKTSDIEWIDAAGDYMCVHAGGNTHIMRKTMKDLQTLLNPDVFLRIHRSTIVNARCIKSAQTLNNGEYMLSLENGSQLKVSRSYRDKIKQLFGN